MSRVAACLLASLAIGACASELPVDVPAALDPGPSQSLAMRVAAKGMQICASDSVGAETRVADAADYLFFAAR